MLTNPLTSMADGKSGGRYPGGHGCNRDLIRSIVDAENSHYADLVREHVEARKGVAAAQRRAYDKKFCDALQENWDNGRTEARYECLARDCRRDTPTPQAIDDHRDVVEHVRPPRVRQRPLPPVEDDPPPRETAGGGGSLFSNPLVMGIGGLAVGGLLGYMLGQRNGQNQQQQHSMFPPPQWGGQWGQPRMQPPGMLPFQGGQGGMPFGGGGAPYALPYGQTNPWAQPYMGGVNQFAGGYNQYGGGQFSGGYRGPAPSVLPLAPQPYSPFSVGGGSIQQSHWNLINVGR